MYTIMMDKDKNLITTVRATLYQREKLVDKIQFLFPVEYEDVDLSQCSAYLKYLDQANVAHTEPLVLDEELYKDMLRYELPVNTNLTKFAGDITIRVTFLNSEFSEVLHTSESVIKISALSDYYTYVSDESLEVIDQKLLEIQAVADEYQKTKADNLVVERNKLSLTADGEKIGDEVDIVTPRIIDGKYDGEYDGVLDLDEMESDDDGSGNHDGHNGHNGHNGHKHKDHKNHFVEL